jgi:hypothetical protein
MWTNLLCISHNHILVHLSCHSITKTKQGPFTGPVAPAPHVLAYPLRARVRLCCSLSFLPPFAGSSKARALTSATAPACALVGVGHSGHHRAPSAPPYRFEHRLHLVHPVLALARRGNAPVLGDCSPEPRPSSPENTVPWTPSLRSPFSFSVCASRSSCFPGARVPLPVPSLGRRWPTAVEPRHRSAIITGRALPELYRLNRLVHLACLAVGSTVVLTPRPKTSPTASSRRRWLLPPLGCMTCGASGPTVSHWWRVRVHCVGCT